MFGLVLRLSLSCAFFFLLMTLSRLVIVLVFPFPVFPCQDLAVSQLENEYWAMDTKEKVAAKRQDKTKQSTTERVKTTQGNHKTITRRA